MISKSIILLPTPWTLDVWVSGDLNELAQLFNSCYGSSVEYYKDELRENETMIISSTLLADKQRIVMNIMSFDTSILIHECIHVLFKLSHLCGMEVNEKSQEWCAYFIQYIYDEIIKMKPD